MDKNSTSPRVRVVFGVMTWGPRGQTSKEVAIDQLRTLAGCEAARVTEGPEVGKIMLDTARLYQFGESEGLLGEILKENPDLASQVSVHTKAHPLVSPLNREGLHTQCNESLKALGLQKVSIFYLHQPDINVSIEETFGACDELYKAGKFQELGLSNYASWDVARIYSLCKERGWVRPSVYQGLYNAITRGMESELLPALRTYGIRSYWYNPIAGGFLAGKYQSQDQKLTEGRFSPQVDFSSIDKKVALRIHSIYRERYFKKRLFDALDVVRQACNSEGIPMADAAIRWGVHHSAMKGKHHDAVLFGASSLAHMKQNIKAYTDGELPQTILTAFDEAWQVATPEAESYMRGYGQKPGSSEIYLSKF